jgi:hypothetical protein
LRHYLTCFVVSLSLLGGSAVTTVAAESVSPGGPHQIRRSADQAEMQLKTNKVLVTQRVFRHIFEPYLHPEGPIFVTSDAVSTAYNTLMTESFRRFERINAQRLPEILFLIWEKLNADKKGGDQKSDTDKGVSAAASGKPVDDTVQQIVDIRKQARNYARMVIAVALKLLSREPNGIDDELQAEVGDIHRRIEAGGRLSEPSATYFETVDVDPERFRPRGFYTQSEDLQRYFRALRWLQAAPFRVESDAEMLAILLLGKVVVAPIGDKSMERRGIENYFRCYRELTGRRSDRDVLLAAQIVRDRPADMNVVREFLARGDAGQNRIDTDDAGLPTPENRTYPDGEAFTVMGAGRRSDGRLIEITSSDQASTVEGIALCAALGSNYARREWSRFLPAEDRDRRLAALDKVDVFLSDSGLFDHYLNCLAALADPVEPDAPLFMFTDAWEIKNCNTVLSGWVQARRIPPPAAFPEAGRQSEYYGALPEGFVEPEPEFFARMGELVERSREILERCGVFIPPREVLSADLRTFARLIEQGRYPPGDGDAVDFMPEVQAAIDHSRKVLTVLGNLKMTADGSIGAQAIPRIRSLAEDIESGRYDNDPTYQGLIIDANIDLNQIWRILGQLCRRLEVMAHKQLRGIAFNEKESYFLADFGIRLATVMLQGGGGDRALPDDFPLMIPMPGPDDDEYIHTAAIGRPRELLVLYPVQGQEVLCHGAVVPYYEPELSQPLTDREWIRRLDSDERPAEPRWSKPIFAPGPIEKAW